MSVPLWDLMDSEVKVPLAWRICKADPSGLLMWFDPTREEPLLRSLPHDSEEPDGWYEGGALHTLELFGEREVEPHSGADAETSQTDLEDDLPF